jgi:glycerol-3-phosphate dehydrogenase
MNPRNTILEELRQNQQFDVVVIGGGASGIGAALEACLRGYKTLLLEKHDFTKGTSSRSTKLIHGGVRYMAQGDLKMVREALRERGYLVRNAPHLVHDQPFIIPNYRWWEGVFYTVGLKFYDLLAGKFSLGKSVHLNREKVLKLLPGISPKGLRGGVLYHDGQFDDSRLAIDLLHELFAHGGVALNYAEVMALEKEDDRVSGVVFRDVAGSDAERKNVKGQPENTGNSKGDAKQDAGENAGEDAKANVSGNVVSERSTLKNYVVKAGVVINATGVWVDEIMKMDRPGHKKMIRPSQGVHLVLDKSFLPGDHALMIPKTSDGRVLFAVPWQGHLVVGTTDTPVDSSSEEPVALEEEIRFILETATEYLERPVEREDVLSVFAGLRPLAAPKDGSSKTKEISRNHKIIVSESKLITVIGGKWTTYRKMGQDMIDTAVSQGLLSPTESQTISFRIMNSGMYEPENGKRDSGLRESSERGNGDSAVVVRGTGDRGTGDHGIGDRGAGKHVTVDDGKGDHVIGDRSTGDTRTGHHGNDTVVTVSRYSQYGDHAGEIAALVDKEPALGVAIHRDLPYSWAEVEWICRNEMVVHLEDLMARRLRALFLNAQASMEIAGEVGKRIAPVLGWSSGRKKAEIKDFMTLSKNYMLYQ